MRTLVWDVRFDSGTIVHGQRVDGLGVDETADPLPRLRSRTYRVVNAGAQMAYAWDRVGN